MQEFKISSSQIGKIMGGNIGLTETQETDLKTLLEKTKLTLKQTDKRDFLIKRKANPELPQGAKTYCKTWLKEQMYNRRKEFSNKYTDKGNINEDWSIDFIADYLGYGFLIKNTERKYGEFIEGECDVARKTEIIDVKNSWDFSTFPILETEIPDSNYYGQGQGYMDLWNKDNYKLIYILSDTPMELIEKEAYYWCKSNGYGELDADVLQEFIEKMTYPGIEDNLKIKVFEFKRDQEYINEVHTRVKMCRVYIETLIKQPLERYQNYK